jgi:amino acid adenylation domain-containing protein
VTDDTFAPLVDGFLSCADRFADRPALEVGSATLTYRALRDRAAALAATLQRADRGSGPALTAVFAARSETAFAGVLGALMRGHGYVPLNPRHPTDRSRAMLERSGCRAIVVDRDAKPLLPALLSGVRRRLVIVLPDDDDAALSVAEAWPHHTVLRAKDLAPAEDWRPVVAQPDDLAYLLFTSGSTGTPKGVMVAQRNVRAFVAAVADRYAVGPEDRLSQMFDLTFDLSAFDMFVAWERGACLCCPREAELMAPARFIRDSRLTIWFSVPSVGVFARRLGLLKPGAFPSLRLSLFCGEPLPNEVAVAWGRAAPASIVENLYGPTEATIACTAYRWDDARGARDSLHGLVPIGAPLGETRTMVADSELREVAPGGEGELLVAGPQVTLGYWADAERTAAAFVVPPGRREVHYRTGDRVRRPIGDGPLCFLGRTDGQIKVLGHRIELGEVEAILREAAGIDAVVAVGWPLTATGAAGIVAFAGDTTIDPDAVLVEARRRLPAYMVPRELRVLPDIPLNVNGKMDRGALLRSLQEEGARVAAVG